MKMKIDKISSAALKSLQVANEQNVAVCITVTDDGGHIVYQIRMNDANFMTNEVSFLKAKTAFLFKCPSHVLRTITEKAPVLVQAIQQVPGDACMLEGGLPLKLNEKIVGGVGVSGGNFEQDLLIAIAFVETLSELQNGN
ncbi:heme-binding protein [Panacibacter ginsenosidivorans]|uniref:Heme-binding protein n=1 Tax=Panacibacter ginsenosidivorans TaxID=1813871 RepID=A0A5B8VDM1_9BACT|nr:heme-binding protein [Panacibacter ginsenosidivorans]QEC69540.1 heme-binding protein [Panacibacter ginsenosidivorans]